MAYNLADGQLAASAATILGPDVAERVVTILLRNTSASTTETVVLTVSRSGSNPRSLFRAVLAPHERYEVVGLPLDPSDTLKGSSTNATTTDYLITSSQGGALSCASYDANGALKQTISAGTQSVGGNLTVTGDTTLTGDLTVNGGDIDAGASGAAGTVDIFPATSAKGKTQFTVTDNTGNTTTTITTGAQATTRTYTVPDALADADFLMGKQAAVARTATVAGATTGTIAAAGMRQHVTVTSANSAHIIILPTPTPGTEIILDVGVNGFQLQSSTPASVAINGGTGASAKSAIPANSTAVMYCVSATAWKGFYMDADSDLAKVPAAA
jgi:hypothetical protein